MQTVLSTAQKYIKLPESIRPFIIYGLITLVVYMGIARFASKHTVEIPFAWVLVALVAALCMGIVHYAAFKETEMLGTTMLFTVSLTMLAFLVLLAHLHTVAFATNLLMTPFFALFIFAMDRFIDSWQKIPPFIPPSIVISDFEADNFTVLARSQTFIQLRIYEASMLERAIAVIDYPVREQALTIPLKNVFLHFIWYNNNKADNTQQVCLTTSKGQPYKWIFYSKIGLGTLKKYLTPTESLHEQRSLPRSSWFRNNGTQKITLHIIRQPL